ncbi:MAG: hypothetical protein O7A07_02880, partial [Acidobacteria bacterium]|nr:hypothetical protein [Acidobacteriota bacterium]
MSSGKRVSLLGRVGLLAVLATLLPAGLLRAQGVDVPEVEPNDTLAQATLLPLPNLTIGGLLSLTDDVDFYQTTLSEGNVIRVLMAGFFSNFDGRAQILNASGVVLAEGARPPGTGSLLLSHVITAATPPGIGYLRFSNDFIDL